MWPHRPISEGQGSTLGGSGSLLIWSVSPETGLTIQTHKRLMLKPNACLLVYSWSDWNIYILFYLIKECTHFPSQQESESICFTKLHHSVLTIKKKLNNWQVQNGFHLSRFLLTMRASLTAGHGRLWLTLWNSFYLRLALCFLPPGTAFLCAAWQKETRPPLHSWPSHLCNS